MELENGFSPYPDFFRIYNSQLHSQHVEIPSDYNKYYPKPLPQTAFLRKPKGDFWIVKWTMSREEIISFQDYGWSKFVKDNGLIDGDFVLFTYDGYRGFWVRILRNGLLVKATEPIDIQEISDDEDETVVIMINVHMEEDSSENKIISLSLGSSDDSYAGPSCEVNNAHGIKPKKKNNAHGSSKRVGAMKKYHAAITDPTAYLDDPQNPFFISTSSGSMRFLAIAKQFIGDNVLRFGRTINLIDGFGELERKVGEWKDRVVVHHWDEMCNRNNAKPGDKIICEVIRENDIVRSIKVHFVKK